MAEKIPYGEENTNLINCPVKAFKQRKIYNKHAS